MHGYTMNQVLSKTISLTGQNHDEVSEDAIVERGLPMSVENLFTHGNTPNYMPLNGMTAFMQRHRLPLTRRFKNSHCYQHHAS